MQENVVENADDFVSSDTEGPEAGAAMALRRSPTTNPSLNESDRISTTKTQRPQRPETEEFTWMDRMFRIQNGWD